MGVALNLSSCDLCFLRKGEESEVLNNFKEVYEGYDKARTSTKETFGNAK